MVQGVTPKEYYVRRAAQERSAADRTSDAVARRVHRELADRYEALSTADPVA